jgi:predicted TIM-barrel fold metal-dependent hydrolase
VLGKLLLAVGEDRVLWGTDSIWYGSPQPAIDRVPRVPDPRETARSPRLSELTREVKAKILGGNARAIYGIDLAARSEARDLAWLGREASGSAASAR